MNLSDIVYSVSMVLPLIWLAWLALRPFAASMNRLLFFVVGMTIYGYFVNAFVVPMTDVYEAYLVASRGLPTMTGVPASVAPPEAQFGWVGYLGITLVAACLLMLWAQRALARSPRAASESSHRPAQAQTGHG